MDTTTVNYAIEKITLGWGKIAPQVSDVSGKYIHFVVMKTVAEFVIATLISVPVFFVLKRIIKKGIKEDEINEPRYILPAIGLSFVFVIAAIISIFTLYNSILAVSCPEMYVIHNIINSTK